MSMVAMGGAEPVSATIDMPATVILTPPGTSDEHRRYRRVVVTISKYEPSQDRSPVQVVVKGQSNAASPEVELGRFGIMPAVGFPGAHGSKGQRFALPLPRQFTSGEPFRLNIYLVPSVGEGRDARIEISGAVLE